jgi:hypothetical protein
MKTDVINIGIILVYFAVIIILDLLVSRKAIKYINPCFPVGNALPPRMPGVSNASGMFDDNQPGLAGEKS